MTIKKKGSSMGDKEFEKFFEENHGGDGEDGINPSCHQRLLLEAISDRADTINNMYNTTAEFLSNSTKSDPKTAVPLELKTIRSAEVFLVYLMDQAKIIVEQSDYLISRITDGFDSDEEDDPKLKE